MSETPSLNVAGRIPDMTFRGEDAAITSGLGYMGDLGAYSEDTMYFSEAKIKNQRAVERMDQRRNDHLSNPEINFWGTHKGTGHEISSVSNVHVDRFYTMPTYLVDWIP